VRRAYTRNILGGLGEIGGERSWSNSIGSAAVGRLWRVDGGSAEA
jgi:hypothetical protein